MNLFEIQARSDGSEFRSRRKWLIVADSLYEAMWLIPQEWRVNAVEVRPAAARGPGRVIGWMEASTFSQDEPAAQIPAPSCLREGTSAANL